MPIVLVNEIPTRTLMITQFLRKGKGFTNQTAASLAHSVVQPFHQARLPAGFVHRCVPFRGQDTGIHLIKISETDRSLTVFGRQGKPQLRCCFLVAGTNGTPDYQAGFGINRPPEPDLVRLAADERP